MWTTADAELLRRSLMGFKRVHKLEKNSFPRTLEQDAYLGPSVPPYRTHHLIEPTWVLLFHWFATSYLCGELCLFVGWFPEFLFTEVKFSSQH